MEYPTVSEWLAKQDGRTPSKADHCRYCRWALPVVTRDQRVVFSCSNPRCSLGQASTQGGCCSFEREPGSDDDL